MVLIVIIGLYIVIVLMNEQYGANKRKGRVLNKIRETWGKAPANEFDARDYERFASFFSTYGKKNTNYVIDDITWNDLEMDKLYAAVNSTHTTLGDQVLYSYMRTPSYDAGSMEERKNLIRFWTENKEIREKVQVELERFGKFRDRGPSVLLGDTGYLDLSGKKWFRLLSAIPLASLLVMIVNVWVGLILFMVSAGFNFYYHEYILKELDEKIATVSETVGLIALAGRLSKIPADDIKIHTGRLSVLYDRLKGALGKFSSSFFLTRSGDVMQDMADIPKMIFMTDLWSYQLSVNFLRDKKEDIARMIEAIGLLDATISVASYRKSLGRWCVPDIIPEPATPDGFHISAENAVHPLISNCTGNPVRIKRPVLLTGSNASGKSTYLKVIAINTLLAHSIATCLADSWRSVPLFPITSIALRDNVLNGESYFVAEIKSLRRIFLMANSHVRCLCIVDEVLRGTNTIERIAASSRLLSALAGLNTCLIAATHDVELTAILANRFENRHFEEVITDHDITFDYEIKEGRAKSRNAIKLLGLMGFDAGLTEDCEKAVNYFENNSQWENIKPIG